MKSIIIKLLRFLGRRIIKKYKPSVIGITGSVGKTAAKEAVAAVLASKYRVRKSEGNYNTEIGLPLTIIGVKSGQKSPIKWLTIFIKALGLIALKFDYPKMLVLEMGADKAGDISYLLKIATPQVGIITSIAPVHTEGFGSVETIAREKGKLFRAVPRDGWLVVNLDDKEVERLSQTSVAHKITYGINHAGEADMKARECRVNYSNQSATGIAGISFKLVTENNVTPVVLPGVLGEHQIYPSLIAAAVGKIFGINLVVVAESLRHAPLSAGRMRILPGIKHTIIIDDSYNSSPLAASRALRSVAGLEVDGAHRFAVLGDMLELGSISEREHRRLGQLAAELKFDVLLTIGERAKDIARGAVKAGMSADSIFSFANADEARLFIQPRIKEGDVILVKGSRGIHLEIVVKEIMAQPEKAKELLISN